MDEDSSQAFGRDGLGSILCLILDIVMLVTEEKDHAKETN
jgi:hypothetical protein